MKQKPNNYYQLNSIILPVIMLILLGVGLFAAVRLTGLRQILKSRASLEKAAIELGASKTASVGGEFEVPVILSLKNQEIVAADIVLDFDKGILELKDVTPKPDSANNKLTTYLPKDNNGFNKNKVLQAANSTGRIEFGAVCFSETGCPQGQSQDLREANPLAILKFKTLKTGSTSVSVLYSPNSKNNSNLINRAKEQLIGNSAPLNISVAGTLVPTATPVPPPLTTTLTLSKTSGFVSGETITLNFATTGGGNITIHTSIQEGITDPSQKRDCPSSCYQGFPSNTARKTARVPFYVEYLATDSQGNKEETKTMLVVAASTPPPVAVPADSLRGNCSNNQLSLTWQPFPGINRYLVRVDDTANDWGLPLRSGDFMDDNVTSTSYSNSNAKPGHTYRWWIHTIDNNGQFVRFNGVDSFTGPNVICSAAPASKPAVPAGLTSSCPAPGTTASLSWNPVAGADYYALRVNNSTTGGWNGSCTGSAGDFCSERETGNSKSFTSAAGNNYDWWIHACNSAGCGDGSPQAHFTCGSPTPARIPNPADLNNDGVVNAQDAQTIFELYGNSGSNNQQVTASDYVNILQNFGK